MVQRLLRPAAFAALLIVLGLPAARAGNFGVSPVNLVLPAGARSASMTVTNNEKTPIAVRIRLYAWSKRDGADALAPAADLVVTPPIVRLEGGKSQLVRIGRPQRGPAPDLEGTYRVIVSEIPLQGGRSSGPAIQTLLEMSVPLFVPPAEPVRALSWQVQSGDGRVTFTVANTGTAHGKVTQLRLYDTEGSLLGERPSMFYTLPRQETRVDVPVRRVPAPGERLRLEYRLNNAPRTAELGVPQP